MTAGTTTGTLNLTTQAAKTVTPTESVQTAVSSYRWTTGNVNVAAISSTYVGTGITTRSSANLTVNGSVVTAPAGYYSTAATKSITAGSAFPPAVTITKAPTFSMNSSTGVVTASYTGSSSITPTVNAGYISQGTAGTISTTGTSTYQLTSKAAATIYPSTADQTIVSYRWLTGTQTIKSVITSNLTAENIAEGVNVKVGDTNNAGRIINVTGTHKGGTTYTCTITRNGTSGSVYITYNGVSYYSANSSFNFSEGDTITIYVIRGQSNYFTVNNKVIAGGNSQAVSGYTFTLPANSVNISFTSSPGVSYANMTIPNMYVAIITGDSNGDPNSCYIQYNDTKYYTPYSYFLFNEGDLLYMYVSGTNGGHISVNNMTRADVYGAPASYTYILTGGNYEIYLNNVDDPVGFKNVSVKGGGFSTATVSIYNSSRSYDYWLIIPTIRESGSGTSQVYCIENVLPNVTTTCTVVLYQDKCVPSLLDNSGILYLNGKSGDIADDLGTLIIYGDCDLEIAEEVF